MIATTAFSHEHYYCLIDDGWWLVPISYNRAPMRKNWRDYHDDAYKPNTLYGLMPSPSQLIVHVGATEEANQSWMKFLTHVQLPTKFTNLRCWGNTQIPAGSCYMYLELEGVNYTNIPRSHHSYPGLTFLTHGNAVSVLGGQQLDTGWYILNHLLALGTINDFSHFGDPLPYLDDKNALQPPKKTSYEASDIDLSDLIIEFIDERPPKPTPKPEPKPEPKPTKRARSKQAKSEPALTLFG